jgi:hypothetical protein
VTPVDRPLDGGGQHLVIEIFLQFLDSFIGQFDDQPSAITWVFRPPDKAKINQSPLEPERGGERRLASDPAKVTCAKVLARSTKDIKAEQNIPCRVTEERRMEESGSVQPGPEGSGGQVEPRSSALIYRRDHLALAGSLSISGQSPNKALRWSAVSARVRTSGLRQGNLTLLW